MKVDDSVEVNETDPSKKDLSVPQIALNREMPCFLRSSALHLILLGELAGISLERLTFKFMPQRYVLQR